MSEWELPQGLTDDYYTPPEVFDALNCGTFDMDVAAAHNPKDAFVNARTYISANGLETDWIGFIWCNPPYGKRGSKLPWVEKLIEQGNGLLLMPDRTSADWWVTAAKRCADLLTTYDKIKFIGTTYSGCGCKKGTTSISTKEDVSFCTICGLPVTRKKLAPIPQPGTGNTIFAFGEKALEAVRRGEENNFGMTHRGAPTIVIVGVSPSWIGVIEIVINRLNGKGSVQDIYEAVERLAPDKIQGNKHWRAKIRQKLQEHFTRVERGIYKPRNETRINKQLQLY